MAEPARMGVRGACAHHPERPGARVLQNGSMLCDPCLYRMEAFREMIEYAHQMPGIDPTARFIVAGFIHTYYTEHTAAERPA